jgi:hypothetical protein
LILLVRKSLVECHDEIINNTGFPLEFIPYLTRGGNDMFFQSVLSLSVIPAKLVLDSDRGAGIQELIDSLSIVDKQIKLLTCKLLAISDAIPGKMAGHFRI